MPPKLKHFSDCKVNLDCTGFTGSAIPLGEKPRGWWALSIALRSGHLLTLQGLQRLTRLGIAQTVHASPDSCSIFDSVTSSSYLELTTLHLPLFPVHSDVALQLHRQAEA